MTTAMMMDRTGLTMPGMMPGGASTPTAGMPMAPNWMMVPRCTFKMEKVAGGMRIDCVCDDPTAVAMLQNLVTMMQGGMVSCCCMMNGMTVCSCNLMCGLCKCEMTRSGCCVTCTSGDKACCDMIQGCCDCLSACLKAGCTCCLMMSNTPVCCGTM
jgi:hypothetical protein